MAGRPKKSLSQNFLSDPRILARIADAVGAGPADTVLEIGPGKGALTRELLQRAGKVVAIEKDRELAAELGAWSLELQAPSSQLRAPSSQLQAHEADALAADWRLLAGPDFLVAGNIPYNITSPLIDKALTPPRPRRVVFLVQKEVAERVAAAPGTSEYGALTVGVQAVAQVEKLFTVPRGAFYPVPKVDSAVLRLTPLAEPLVRDDEVAAFRRFVVGMFGFRRKQLARALRELTGASADAVAALFTAHPDLPDPSARPGELSPTEFVTLFRLAAAQLGSESPA